MPFFSSFFQFIMTRSFLYFLVSFFLACTQAGVCSKDGVVDKTVDSMNYESHSKRDSLSGSVDQQNNQTGELQETLRVQASLNSFLAYLRVFTVQGSFNHQAFELQSEMLKQQLLQVSEMVDAHSVSQEVASQLKFIKHVFQTMADSVEQLTHYSLSTDRGHRWVYKIIDLNIRLLALHDVSGKLDLLLKCVSSNLFLLWRNLTIWSKKFTAMENVQFSYQSMYTMQSQQAESVLRKLVVQIPDSALSACV